MPVIYGNNDDYLKLPKSNRFLFQPVSTKTADWRRENEWRLPNDLQLRNIKHEDILILVKKTAEKNVIESVSPYRIIALDEIFQL